MDCMKVGENMERIQTNYEVIEKAFKRYSNDTICSRNPIFDFLYEEFFHNYAMGKASGCYGILPCPTGLGKTYATICLIIEMMICEILREIEQGESFEPKYCYYITNSVDNVSEAYCSLRKIVRETTKLSEDQKTILLQRVLYLPSTTNSLLDAIEHNRTELDLIRKMFSFDRGLSRELDNVIIDYEAIKSIDADPKKKKRFEQKVATDASYCYSAILKHINNIQQSDKRVELNDNRTKCLAKLIPGVMFETGKARTMFMTTLKFLHGFHLSTEKFHPSINLDENILIVDEVDRQQQEILNHLISANNTDLLSNFRTVHSNLRFQTICTKPKYKGIDTIFANFLGKVQDFFNRWNLQYSFDIDPFLKKEKKETILFSDKLTTHITNWNEKLRFSFNETTSQHEIALKDKHKGIREEHDFPKFLGELERLIVRGFISVLQRAESRYRENSSQIPKSEESAEFYLQIIASILAQLNLYPLLGHYRQQLKYLVGRQRPSRRREASYHRRGLKMVEIGNLPEAHDSVMFKAHGFETSPTGMIATWVEGGANIIGISATADCESVIHNFDNEYLKETLADSYIKIPQDRVSSIHEYYHSERNYTDARVAIDVEPVEYNPDFLKKLIKQWKPQNRNTHLIYEDMFEKDNNKIKFGIEWLSKLCQAIESFSSAKNNRYMMAMLNRFPQNDIPAFLNWYSDHLNSINTSVKLRLVCGVNSNFLKSGRYVSDVIDFLENQPGKIVVITTYQTMSSGKNPDYEFDPRFENDSLNHVGNRSNKRTDIDYMYLEEPTNLISVGGELETKTSDRLKLLSYSMALQEAGEISVNSAGLWARKAVSKENLQQACSEIKSRFYSKHKSDDCLHGIFRMIEQAVGRSARTEMKRDRIVFKIDSMLMELLARDFRESSLFSHEYNAIRNFARNRNMDKTSSNRTIEKKTKHKAILHTLRSEQAINRTLYKITNDPNEDNIESWRAMRLVALQYPATLEAPEARQYYLKSPYSSGYTYSINDSTKDLDTYSFFENTGRNAKQVSEIESRLPALMKNPIIREHFARNNYCMKWSDEAKFFLTPPMFINIYLGALGEEAAKAILASYGFRFHPLPICHFEQFDEIIEIKGKRALIDFKYWNLGSWRNLPKNIQVQKMDHIKSKLNSLSIDKLVICNVIASQRDGIQLFDKNFVETTKIHLASIIAVPCLLCEETSEINNEAIHQLATWILY